MLVPTEWQEDDDGVKQKPETDFEIIYQHPLHPYERTVPVLLDLDYEQISDYTEQVWIMALTVINWEREVIDDLRQLASLDGGLIVWVVSTVSKATYYAIKAVRIKLLGWLFRGVMHR
jgi:hypothetical protein